MKTKNIYPFLLVSLVLAGGSFAVAYDAPSVASTPADAKVDERKFDRVTDVKRGDRVVLRGQVARIAEEDEFILADESGRIRVYIGWKNDLPVKRGDTVIVEGRADDDALFGTRPEIYARVLELTNGERITLLR